jgi:hypothetical protein
MVKREDVDLLGLEVKSNALSEKRTRELGLPPSIILSKCLA